MELQLEKQKQMVYEKVLDRTAEETCSADFVVPDALADVGVLLMTEGSFSLWKLDFSEKNADIEGCINASVCYTEEQTGAICSFPVELPVKMSVSAETLSPDVRPFAVCTVSDLESQIVNSRKVRTRARLSVHLRAYRAGTMELADGVACGEQKIFTNCVSHRFHAPVAVEEKTFTISEEHPFRLARPENDQLLSHTETVQLDEQKIVGSKVILQGKVVTTALYRQAERAIPVTEVFETPFSQMIESGADGELSHVRTRVQLTAAYQEVSGSLGAHGGLQVEYHLVAQTVCLAEVEATCVSDAYSNAVQLQLAMQEQPVIQVSLMEPVRAVAEDAVEVTGEGLSVCGSRCALQSAAVEDGAVSGSLSVTVLLTSADGTISAVHKEIRFSQPIVTDGRVEIAAARLEEPYVAMTAGAVSVRVPVTIEAFAVQEQKLRQVLEITCGEDPTAFDSLPSLTVVRPDAACSLWELAKRYCSSVETIRAVNGLGDGAEDCEMPQFLLIPKTRA